VKLDRVLAITRKQFLTLRHDPRSLALMLLAPIMAMVVFGFAFGNETRDVRTLVVNEDEGEEAAAIIALLDPEALSVEPVTDAAAARRAVEDGEATALLVFPPGFTRDVMPTPGTPPSGGTAGIGGAQGTPPQPPNGTSIEVVLDSTNAQLAGAVQRALQQALRDWADAKGAESPVSLETQVVYAEGARFIDSFVPGIMAFAALLFTTLLTLLAFVGERTTGTLDRLRTTPLTEGEFVMGYVLAFGAIAAVQGVLLLGAAILLFDILIVGNVALAGLLIVLLAIDAMAIGILVSAAARREGQAVQFIPFIILPTFLLSGIFVPVESLPGWLQPLAWALPPTWAVDGLRDVMLRGWGLERVWVHASVLAGFAVVFVGLAVLGLKRARA
jgi:ABC-2 type transport system permease protein